MIHKYTQLSGVVSILAEDEQPPYEICNPGGSARLLITCDHASNRIPRSLGTLGLDSADLSRHIAWDIGCAALARRLSDLLDARAILGGFSRLVVDLNRHLNDPTSIPPVSDSTHVPGNTDLPRAHAAQRIEELFVPYQNAVVAQLAELKAVHGVPAIISLHSFTPVWGNFERPWHIGVLWNRDARIAAPLIEALRKDDALCVGDNQPYHAREPVGYGMDVHAEGNGLPHALLEIRQDLLVDDDGVERWANILNQALRGVLADDSIYFCMEF
jgi:predicted N-formylglutamate amidohydrolase